MLDVLLMRNAAGLTAWIVNHQDVIPGFVNRLAHLFFFVFMDLTIIITAEYMYEQLIGIDKNKTKALFLRRIPGVLSLLLITAGIGGTSGAGLPGILWASQCMSVTGQSYFIME